MPWAAIAAALYSSHRRMLGLPEPEPAPPDPVHEAMCQAATAHMQMAMLCPDEKVAAEAMKTAMELQWKMVEHNIRKSFESYGEMAVKFREEDGRLSSELVHLRDPGTRDPG
jgi:hypothetical protein